MKFYTGITKIAMFNLIFTWIKPCISRMIFWRGSKRIFASRVSQTRRRFQKVCGKDQFLLVLMRLRLGLFNEALRAYMKRRSLRQRGKKSLKQIPPKNTFWHSVNLRISALGGLFILDIFGWGVIQGGGLIRRGLIKL